MNNAALTAALGQPIEITVKNRVAVFTNMPPIHGPNGRKRLSPEVVRINGLLSRAGLLDNPFRCQAGGAYEGSPDETMWLLLVGRKRKNNR